MRRSNAPRGDMRSNALWGGSRGESRRNALWGSRSEKRSNALWGRGGRGMVVACVGALTLVLPLVAGAGNGNNPGIGAGTFISSNLLANAKQNPGAKIHVIVQSNSGSTDAENKVKGLGEGVTKRLGLIGAVAVDITAGKLDSLSRQPGLTITPDSLVKLSGSVSYSNQMWPYESGVAKLWGTATRPAPQAPTIAVVDSGIDANRLDFDGGSRIVGNVTMTSLPGNSPGDGRGHGTFVAGIAAGSAPGYAGAAPNARILSIDVMDDTGKALTSDVISAAGYILANKAAMNIRVANFSLHSSSKNHFYNDPLDKAVEKLWFNGIFVVAAAGNYGTGAGPSGVLYAPGNDPFVMTVGAVDLGNSVGLGNDNAAPWSAYGYTEDGFAKPEIGAAGRYMVGPVPPSSTLVAQKADHVVAPGYIELSGTSFAAPIVAGAAAQIIALHPGWSPDQVKGALMLTAKPAPNAVPRSIGVGEVNASRAAQVSIAPNANASIDRYLTQVAGGGLSFDSASWNSAVTSNASWSDASWADASWASASWSAASWADASWADASWADTSTEDAAEGDAGGPPAVMDAAASAALQSDPDLALPTDQVLADPAVVDPTATKSLP